MSCNIQSHVMTSNFPKSWDHKLWIQLTRKNWKLLSNSPSATWKCLISCCHQKGCLHWCIPCTPHSSPSFLSFSSPLSPSLPVFWPSSPLVSPELSSPPSVFSFPPFLWLHGPHDETLSYQMTRVNWTVASLCLWRHLLCSLHSFLPPRLHSSSFALGFCLLFFPCLCCHSCTSLSLAPSSACLWLDSCCQDFSVSSFLCHCFHHGSQSCAETFPFSLLWMFLPSSPFPFSSSLFWFHLNQSCDIKKKWSSTFLVWQPLLRWRK